VRKSLYTFDQQKLFKHMLDTFKARLRAKAKTWGVNLSTKRIDALADRLHKKNPDLTDEADHDSRIDDLNEITPLEDMAKQDDRIRSLETKSKAQPPKKEEQTSDDDDEEDDDDKTTPAKPKSKKNKKDEEPPAWAKSLIATVEGLSKDKTQTSIQAKIATMLKDKVPAKFYAKRTLPESEDDLDDFIAEVETDWTELKQDQVNAGLGSLGNPGGGGENNADNTSVSDKSVRANMDKFFAKDKKEQKA
jgi:hypothetical protein